MLFLLLTFVFCVHVSESFNLHRFARKVVSITALDVSNNDGEYDSQGYLIKTKESGWFNGLSTNPGDSLSDPRSVPPEAVAFADKIKSGTEVTFSETMSIIDEHYFYFEVPFYNGELENKANENIGSAKIFAFGLMTKMTKDQCLLMFGEHYKSVLDNPSGSDHQNIRTFQKSGWDGINFERGLPISSKLQAGDDTDSVFSSQAQNEGEGDWSFESDSWIP